MAYAVDTEVSVERTRADIEKLLTKHKCSSFLVGRDTESRQAMVQFRTRDRIIRFIVTLPDPKEDRFRLGRYGSPRPQAQRDKLVEQAEKTKWRALLLVIKAKLEAVESNIASFEEEFLAHIVLPNDRTVADMVIPYVARAYSLGSMPQSLLPAAGETETH